MRYSTRWLLSGLVLLVVAAVGRGQASYQDLLNKIPANANAVLVVDYQALQRSPIGVKENWQKQREHDYAAGIANVPPIVDRVVVGALLDPGSMEPVWRVGLTQVNIDLTPAQMAQGERGTIDRVADQDVVVSPRNACFFFTGPRTIAVQRPANRQELARWLRSIKQTKGPTLTPYLQQAAAGVTAQTPAVLAIDLADVIDARGIRNVLEKSQTLQAGRANLDALAPLFTSLKGIRIVIRAGDRLQGEMHLDFGQSVAPLAPFAKNLVLEGMAGMGMAIEDLEGWESRAQGNTITLSGPLTIPGGRKLLSPLLSPGAALQEQAPSTADKESQADITLRYFRSINALMAELRKKPAKSWGDNAKWFDLYAKMIDELPILGVDPEVRAYGRGISALFRQLAQVCKGVVSTNLYLNVNMQESTVSVPTTVYGGAAGYGPYGYGGYGYGYTFNQNVIANNYREITNQKLATASQVTAVMQQAWQLIDNTTQGLRTKMTDKYKVEFN